MSHLFQFVPPPPPSDQGRRGPTPAPLLSQPQPSQSLPFQPLPTIVPVASTQEEQFSHARLVQLLLARCLVDEDFVYTLGQTMLPDDWAEHAYTTLYRAIVDVWNIDHEMPTKESLFFYLEQQGQQEQVKHIPIEALFSLRVGPSQANEYVRSVLLYGDSRSLMAAATKAYDLGAEQDREGIPKAVNLFEGLSSRRENQALATVGSVTGEIVQSITAGGSGNLRVVMTGMNIVDRPLIGLHPGRLIVLAMPTGEGKTSFSLNLAGNVARWSGCAVYYASQEQGVHEVARALLAQWTGRHVPWILFGAEPALRPSIGPVRLLLLSAPENLRQEIVTLLRAAGEKVPDPHLTPSEALEIANAQAHIEQMTILLDDSCHDSDQFRANVRQVARRHKDKFILAVNDHMHVAEEDDNGNRNRTRTDQISHISSCMKKCSMVDMDGRGAVLAVAQFNRTADKALANMLANSRPDTFFHVSQIKGSGAIEQDADVIFFGHRRDRRAVFDQEKHSLLPGWGLLEMVVKKNRQTGFLRSERMYVNDTSLAILNQMYPIETI